MGHSGFVKARTLFLIVLLMLAVSSLSGCAERVPGSDANQTRSLEFVKWQGEVTERNDYKYILTEGEEVTVGENKYIFESGIDEKTKLDFVDKQEALLSFLSSDKTGFTFYLTKSYIDRGDSEMKSSFTTVDSIGTWKQVLSTIVLLDGNSTLYGYSYARAISLSEELGWQGDDDLEKTEIMSGIDEMLESDPGRIHLFLPCFLEPYSTPEQIKSAKLLAAHIYDDIDTKSMEAFLTALEKYSAERDIEYIQTDCDFIFGGKRYPLIMETPYTVEYVPNTFTSDWTYMRHNGLLENSWLYNMTELVRIRNLLNASMGYAKELVSPELDAKCDVVFFQSTKGAQESSAYNMSEKRIDTYTIHDIAHEYVHYLQGTGISQHIGNLDYAWVGEGLAMWLERDVACDAVNIARVNAGEPNGPMKIDDYLLMYRDDFRELLEERGSVKGVLSAGSKGAYIGGLEMAHYLFEKYGEKEMMDFYLFKMDADGTMKEKMEEYVQEFEEYIEDEEFF